MGKRWPRVWSVVNPTSFAPIVGWNGMTVYPGWGSPKTGFSTAITSAVPTSVLLVRREAIPTEEPDDGVNGC